MSNAPPFASIRDTIGRKIEVDFPEGATVKDLLSRLVDRYGEKLKRQFFNPKTGKPQPYIKVLLNGRDIDFPNGIDTKLNDGDVLALFPPVAGG